MSVSLPIRQYVRKLLRGTYLPCYVFSREPMIIFAYDHDFTKNINSFLKHFASLDKVYLFLQLGWQHETPNTAQPFARSLHLAMSECPGLQITVLANSPNEVTVLSELGLKTVLCHQNSFIDERKYRIKKRKKVFDAIYIARITQFKRHWLAADVKSLRLIGDYYEMDQEYVDETLAMLKHAFYTRIVRSSKIPDEIATAKCGLCLSAEEGAMFVSAEYLLCGIPVVDTANLGGRDVIFPEFACSKVSDDPGAVTEAVAHWAESAPEPEAIRNAVLEKMQVYRNLLRKMINQILTEHGQKEFNGRFPHKLGLRVTPMPWVSWKHGLKN